MNLPPEAGSIAVTAVPWLALGSRIPALRRHPGDPRLRAWCLAALFLALALTVFSAPVYLAVDRLARVPNLSQLLGNEATVVSATAVLVLLTYVDRPGPPPARRVWSLVLTGGGFMALLAVLFVRVPSRPDQPDYWTSYALLPGAAAYRLVYLLCLGYTAVNLTRLGLAYASVSPRPATRLGVRLVALSGVVGCLDVVDECARVLGIGALTGSRTLSATTVFLLVIGGTIPGWGPRVGVDRALEWFADYRSLRRLYPLWRALHRAMPVVAFVPPAGALLDALDLRDVPFRLYRRIVEIGDALVLLASETDGAAGSAELARLADRFLAESAMAAGAAATVGRGSFRSDVRAMERLAGQYREATRGAGRPSA